MLAMSELRALGRSMRSRTAAARRVPTSISFAMQRLHARDLVQTFPRCASCGRLLAPGMNAPCGRCA